ncbi:hypothetical protein PN498_06335 [Oscillatoria sp. CS-180]|nr:hypothetical protein [Oscillatoria sp. CS-180]MDB9525598.1 hypothetical protein [Oscillatoria sp. CS-180]
MTLEKNKSFAEKNEDRVKKAIDKVEEIATDGDDKQEAKPKDTAEK